MDQPSRFRDLRLRPSYQPHDNRLGEFYIPVLKVAVSYDRLVGYWRSSSLAVAAAGLPHFIHNASEWDGRMRVIAGAKLTPADAEALTHGESIDDVLAERLIADPTTVAEDEVVRERLRIVAWMIREGLLQVKIGVPTDSTGAVLTGEDADAYFHTKFGILTDREGDRIVFEGSVNESASGWRHNHEAFSVFRSWQPEVWEEYGQPWVDSFESHWEVTDPVAGWKIVDLPEAVARDFVERTLEDDWRVPDLDPEERFGESARQLTWIKEAPREHGGTGVGFATLPIAPWPHQAQTAARILETWPRSYLLADEVGLGKTIEAGMVIRELLLSGKAKRILILVPASVQRQWQEELWEKFLLDIPSYWKGKFVNYAGETLERNDQANLWGAFPVMIASSHLARMRAQRPAILDAEPWDLVLVDEAHHARRRGAGGAEGANQLLQLLREMKQAGMWKALLLATATPMQMHTAELFDLLDLFGLPGRWGEGPESFDRYYLQLAEPDPKARDWELLKTLLADHLAQPDVEPNPIAVDRLAKLPGPSRMMIQNFHRHPLSESQIAARPPEERDALDLWLRANTPIRDRVFRTSRVALREYKAQGILSEEYTIPLRHVEDRRIDLEPTREAKLYERIEEYISRYYEEYTKEKASKPLGFIMTVYRRRLTSSLYAIHKSLKRRLVGIRDAVRLDDLLVDDDRYVLENVTGFEPDQLTQQALPYAEEIAELESFLSDLEEAIPYDTKAQQVSDEIRRALSEEGHRSVIVFTQFSDTLNWLRDQLASTYGDQIGCYTGQGGSRYNSVTHTWDRLSKGEVKELFRAGDIRILLGTDAMSEGLNLQTCARLINYDMPWNFMRVEQRIGRIDRIGGQPQIWITNYFYKDTVEDRVYSGIAEDAQWFRQVVGPAQPVLGEVETVIERLAMRPEQERDQMLELELAEVRNAIREYQRRAVKVDTLESDLAPLEGGYGAAPVVDLKALEELLLDNPITSQRMHPHPDFAHTYFVEVGGEKHPMTFDRNVYDRNPEIGFMSYGHPVFDELIGDNRT